MVCTVYYINSSVIKMGPRITKEGRERRKKEREEKSEAKRQQREDEFNASQGDFGRSERMLQMNEAVMKDFAGKAPEHLEE